MSRQTIAVSVKASKLTARALAYVVAAVGRKIAKEHRKAQTPHGKQSVRKLMGHGGDTNAIEVDTPKLFDKVARKWGVDYAIHRVGEQKYLLLFKARQADAMTQTTPQAINKPFPFMPDPLSVGALRGEMLIITTLC